MEKKRQVYRDSQYDRQTDRQVAMQITTPRAKLIV